MKKLSFIFALVMWFCCSTAFADSDSQKVVFSKSTPITGGSSYSPLSEVTPPEGYLEDHFLSIDLNSSAYAAHLIIYKDGVQVDHDLILVDDTDGTVGFDLSLYGQGHYRIKIKFSDLIAYEANFSME